jgi:hypothetical protein
MEAMRVRFLVSPILILSIKAAAGVVVDTVVVQLDRLVSAVVGVDQWPLGQIQFLVQPHMELSFLLFLA